MKTLELEGDDWGIHVTRHRKRNGLTMRHLAERAGLGTGTILRPECALRSTQRHTRRCRSRPGLR